MHTPIIGVLCSNQQILERAHSCSHTLILILRLGQIALVLEYCLFGSLRDFLRKIRVTASTAIKLSL